MDAGFRVFAIPDLIASERARRAWREIVNWRVSAGRFRGAFHGCAFRALKTASTAFNALDSVLVVALLFKALVSA